MEYTYKNRLSEKQTTIVLSEYSLSLLSDGNERVIPYANILSVRLSRSNKIFFTIIKPVGQPEVCVSNVCVISNYDQEDCSSQYATFVNTLHFHLKEKSMAYYVCGNNLQHILLAACMLVIMSFGISYLLGSLFTYNSNLVAISLSFISILAVVAANWGRFPNVYKPDNIPSQFLPAL